MIDSAVNAIASISQFGRRHRYTKAAKSPDTAVGRDGSPSASTLSNDRGMKNAASLLDRKSLLDGLSLLVNRPLVSSGVSVVGVSSGVPVGV
jgi:hypothetical protein